MNFKQLTGQIEIDESYFGSRHRGDKRGRSTERKIPVIGILKRKGVVYTKIIPNVSLNVIMPVIKELVNKTKSNITIDQWSSYDGLVVCQEENEKT